MDGTVTLRPEDLEIIQSQLLVTDHHFEIKNYIRKWILVSNKSITFQKIFKEIIFGNKSHRATVKFVDF